MTDGGLFSKLGNMGGLEAALEKQIGLLSRQLGIYVSNSGVVTGLGMEPLCSHRVNRGW